jgi:hypothetical protein
MLSEFQDNRHMKVVRFSALRTGLLYPHEISMVLMYVRGYVDPMGHSEAGKITSTKNPNDPIINRPRDIPACSAVPQPTAPPRARNNNRTILLKMFFAQRVLRCRRC